jgi:hypothetical protein
MQREPNHRLEELRRELDRQDEQWAAVETQLRALGERGVAISREVIGDFDDALSSASRAAMSLRHTLC